MRNSLINYWFNDLENNFFQKRNAQFEQWNYTPKTDVIETDKEFLFHFDLPGIPKEDVEISIHGSALTVTAVRKSEEKKDSDKVHREERYFGKFERVFELPDTVDTESVSAEFKNGVLSVRVAKKEKSQPKVISIKPH